MVGSGESFEIFLVTAPGLEPLLCAEARERGFRDARAVKGGVVVNGGWPEVWRANLELRGAARVLARVAAFRALHLAQLDKRARKVAWRALLRPDAPFRVEAACSRSRIYHERAAAQRIRDAIRDQTGAAVAAEAELVVKARIEDDLCTLSLDTTGEALHKRGHKEEVAKAPLRETLAALFLRACGYDGGEPVVDPMCGSGTFVIEAAEIAAGLKPGRSRHFAFERLATFDAAAWDRMRARDDGREGAEPRAPGVRFLGSDRDAGAIRMSRANAERAGVSQWTEFRHCAVSDAAPPEGGPGLVMVNPPYGARIGDRRGLEALYRALGRTLITRFAGWRVGLLTDDAALAAATGLNFARTLGPVSHGGIRVQLYQTDAL